MPETITLIAKYQSGSRVQRYSSLVEVVIDGTARPPKPGASLAKAIQWLISNNYETASPPHYLDAKGRLTRRQRLSFRKATA